VTVAGAVRDAAAVAAHLVRRGLVAAAAARLRVAEECEAFEVSDDRVSKEIVLILTSRMNYHERNH
jgi:hypothetical protein